MAPHLQPRFYSISSSPRLHPHSVHITCAVVRETMPSGRQHEGERPVFLLPASRMVWDRNAQRSGCHKVQQQHGLLAQSRLLRAPLTSAPTARHPAAAGVASNWLARAKKGGSVPVFVRRSTFRLPASPATPVVMVGPGTGLAPFRGFIQERAALKKSGEPVGRGGV